MKRQRGVAIITAIFLIVILSLLGAFAVRMLGVQQASASLDLSGARAYQAAQAGLEWGSWQVLRPGVAVCVAATTLPALPGSLAEFTVTVTCVANAHLEAGVTVTDYALVSTACLQAAGPACPNPVPPDGYVERQVSATLER